MLLILYVLFAILIIYSIFGIADLIYVTPSIKAERFLLNYNQEKKKNSEFDLLIRKAAVALTPYVKLNKRKYSQIEIALKYKGINISPDVYYCEMIVQILIVLGLAIVFFPFFAPGSFVFCIGAYFIYNNATVNTKSTIREKTKKIERELSRFSSALKQELRGDRNILAFLDRYKESSQCGPELKDEIEVCLTFPNNNDSLIRGLINMCDRVESPDLTEIIRAAMDVVTGNGSMERFERITERLQEKQKATARKNAEKLPNQIMKYNIIVFFIVLAFIAASLIIGAGKDFGGLF